MSTCSPARTVIESGRAIGATSRSTGARNTVIVPVAVEPAPSVTSTETVPIGPGSPSTVVPRTRTVLWSTTAAASSGRLLIAEATMSTRPVVLEMASSTPTVVSSPGRTKAVSGGSAIRDPTGCTLKRAVAVRSVLVTVSSTVKEIRYSPGVAELSSIAPSAAFGITETAPSTAEVSTASVRRNAPEPPTTTSASSSRAASPAVATTTLVRTSNAGAALMLMASSRCAVAPSASVIVTSSTTSPGAPFGSRWRTATRPSPVGTATIASPPETISTSLSTKGSPSASTQPSSTGTTIDPPGASSGDGQVWVQFSTPHQTGAVF